MLKPERHIGFRAILVAMDWTPHGHALRGRVAVVAGATRGAGRGIAAALGEMGATSTTSTPARCGHWRTGSAGTMAPSTSSSTTSGAAEVLKGPPPTWNRPIWEHDLDDGLRILRLGVDTHLITSHCLHPLLIERPGGLLVEVTDGTRRYNDANFRLSVFYELAKAAVNRLAFAHGHEVQPYGATALAVTPGWLRSEMMLDNWAVSEADWREALNPDRGGGLPTAPPGFAESETPRFVGRGIAAIAADEDRARWNQQSVTSADLAREYGFTDVDGRRPDGWA